MATGSGGEVGRAGETRPRDARTEAAMWVQCTASDDDGECEECTRGETVVDSDGAPAVELREDSRLILYSPLSKY